MSLTRTISRNIARQGFTDSERYDMAVSAIKYRKDHHGEIGLIPNKRKFIARIEKARRVKADRIARIEAAKAKKKMTLLERFRATIGGGKEIKAKGRSARN